MAMHSQNIQTLLPPPLTRLLTQHQTSTLAVKSWQLLLLLTGLAGSQLGSCSRACCGSSP